MINIVIFSGTTHAESKMRLMEWMDSIVMAIATENALVKDTSGRRINGCYQMLKQDEHSKIERKLGHYRTWQRQCENNGISAGYFISIEGSGKGQCTLLDKDLGPFTGP